MIKWLGIVIKLGFIFALFGALFGATLGIGSIVFHMVAG